jgi:hypothetical protein
MADGNARRVRRAELNQIGEHPGDARRAKASWTGLGNAEPSPDELYERGGHHEQMPMAIIWGSAGSVAVKTSANEVPKKNYEP